MSKRKRNNESEKTMREEPLSALEWIRKMTGNSVLQEMDGILYLNTKDVNSLRFDDRRNMEHRMVACLIDTILEKSDGYFLGGYWYEHEYVLNDEDVSRFQTIRLRIDPEVAVYQTNTRRPYYQMRGKRITEELALEVIAKTDNYFHLKYDIDLVRDNYISCMNFDQWWFMDNHHPRHYGWCHPSGIVGGNAITQKFPNIVEFIEETVGWIMNFPYLDLVIAVTDWDEIPWKWDWKTDIWDPYASLKYPDFEKHVEIGIHVHDHTVEILNRDHAVQRYREYDKLYGEADPRIYCPGYYEEQGLFPCNEEYLKKCLKINGLEKNERRRF